jgi:hypothetical protein
MAITSSSPGYNAGSNALVPVGLIFDQRGPGYARISGGTVDIGAFEVGLFSDTFTGTGPLSASWQVPLHLLASLSVAVFLYVFYKAPS